VVVVVNVRTVVVSVGAVIVVPLGAVVVVWAEPVVSGRTLRVVVAAVGVVVKWMCFFGWPRGFASAQAPAAL
jgi:hypothetical protein